MAYRVPGVSETVREEENGFFVKDGDVAGLADAVEKAVLSIDSLSYTSRKYAERYSWELAVFQWESKLKSLLNSN